MLARRIFWAVLLGTLLCLANHIGVFAGILDPPPGYQPAHYIRNLDVPQYLTWIELSKTHWLMPDVHAPWRTQQGLFQPMFVIAAHTGLPTIVSYYGLQLLFYWLAAYALILAAQTFLETRRDMLYAVVVMLGAMPLLLPAWVVAKWLHLPSATQLTLGYGLVEYSYDTADGLVRGGLSNSFLLTFGTAMILFSFVNLAKFLSTGRRQYYYWLLGCVFLDGLLHPFEIYVIVAAAIWPLWKAARMKECLGLFAAAGLGMLPYPIQALRCAWIRDVTGLHNWNIDSPVWVLLVFGLPAIAICWLMLARFRAETVEDQVLTSWFLCAAALFAIPAVSINIHALDGYAYVLCFLLVRKAKTDRLMSKLFAEKPRTMRWAVAAWAAVSVLTLGTVYSQLWKDGKSAHPDFLSAVVPVEETAMLSWMKSNLPHDRLVLAPEAMAPWVAAIPMPSMGSHDLFSVTYRSQRDLASRFYAGRPERRELIDAFGVSYVVAPSTAPIQLEGARLLHQEASLRLYEVPGEQMKPYPGLAHLDGAPPLNGFRQWMFGVLEKLRLAT